MVESSAAITLKSSSVVVIKIGSSLLVDPIKGHFNQNWFDSLIQDIATLKKNNQRPILVSSGAIALGKIIVNDQCKRIGLDRSQALASIGQISLAQKFERALAQHSLIAAQVLLTLEDTEKRKRYLNARNALGQLLDMGVVPVINENDTVATSEIRYGDNDRLAARVAQMMSAECLVLLSDVDGLYTVDPRRHENAVLLERIETISADIVAMAGAPSSSVGSGGMVTKIDAATLALKSGCHMILASGLSEHPIKRIVDGSPCSHFVSQTNPFKQRKRWIAGSLQIKGKVVIDRGAIRALRGGSSLLPVGVILAKGEFERGDAIVVCDSSDVEIGRGLSAYSHQDLGLILGKKSAHLSEILGYQGPHEVIHRDDLVLSVGGH